MSGGVGPDSNQNEFADRAQASQSAFGPRIGRTGSGDNGIARSTQTKTCSNPQKHLKET